MAADEEGFRAAGAALGGCISFLQDVLLDKQVLRFACFARFARSAVARRAALHRL